MDAKQIMKIFEDTAYVRMGGSPEERKTAEYLQGYLAQMGLKAELQSFDVDMANSSSTAKIFSFTRGSFS